MPRENTAAETTSAPTSRQLQAEAARAKIISAALTLFASRGFEGASMQQIAKAAKASVPLIVYHFQNKQNLWQATVENAVERFDTHLKQLIQQQESATETLKQIIVALVQASTEFPEFHRLMLLESHENSARLDWLCDRFVKDHNKTITAIVLKAQQEGSVCQIAPERLMHAIVGMATITTQAAEFKKINRKNLFSADEIQKTIDSIHQLVFIEQRQ